MSAPAFSVIVPVLNGEAHLEQCLNSIIDQAETPELIIIDGGSKDATLDIVHNYNKHISYLESGKDSGIANAFNRGIMHAHGDIISILNSDDYWEEDALEVIGKAAAHHPGKDIFIGNCRIHPENSKPYIKKPNLKAMKRYMSAYHPSTFVKRSAYEMIGPYNESYELAMDSDWIHRAIKMHASIHQVPHTLSNMRLGGISDELSIKALREYRQSVIDNDIAPRFYANFFFWLHRTSKTLDKFELARKLRKLVNKTFNKTVEYPK